MKNLTVFSEPAAPGGFQRAGDNDFSWDQGPGLSTLTYEFVYISIDDSNKKTVKELQNVTSYTVQDFVAGTQYQVKLFALANGLKSEAATLEFVTS